MPSTNGPNDYIKKIVKKEGGNSLSFNAKGFTTPLYTEVPKLFSSDGPHSFTKKDFASKYDLCYLGMSPMQIRLLKVCTKEEIEKCFGLIVNKNEHQYINCLDPKLITKVERLKVCTKEEIEKCFGLIVNKNEHQYINCLDPKLITKVERLKVCTKEEIEKCFGLIVNKNGHQYINCLYPKLITKVERLWMIVHQKPYILASRIIILGMARGILCEQKGKQLN
jgi:hypothetical protein